MNASFETLITTYINDKVGIAEDFLSVDLCNNLRNNLLSFNDAHLLLQAGVGNDGKMVFDNLIRSDSIYWLDKTHNNAFEAEFFDTMDEFVAYLNENCFTNIKSYEFHYSLYEAGSFYRTHLDQFEDDTKRQFSMMNYLNADWQPKDGGELLIHHDHHNQSIAPTQGKTVFLKVMNYSTKCYKPTNDE